MALTKIDMVDRDLAELAQADVEDFLAARRYAGAPVVMVSGVTGEGLPELLAELDRLGAAGAAPARLPGHPHAGRPGLLPQRHRHGGHRHALVGDARAPRTPWPSCRPGPAGGAGDLRRGAGAERPGARPARWTSAAGGQRVALNLTGVDRDDVDRGQWVVKDPAIEPTYLADVRLTLLSDAPGPAAPVSRAPGWTTAPPRSWPRSCWPTRRPWRPGESCYAQFRFEEQVLVYPGDQFIVRSVTPVTTIGGGRVIDPAPRKHGTGPAWHERLALLEEGAPDAIVAALAGRMRSRLALMRGRLEASPYLWRFAHRRDRRGSRRPAGRRPRPAGPYRPGRAPGGAAGGRRRRRAKLAPPNRRREARGRLQQPASSTARRSSPWWNARSPRCAPEPRPTALNPYLTLGDLRRELAGGKECAGARRRPRAPADRRRDRPDRARLPGGRRRRRRRARGRDRLERLLGQFDGPPAGEPGAAESPDCRRGGRSGGPAAPRDAQKLVDALVRQKRLVKVGEDLYYPPDRLEALMDRLAAAMEEAGQLTLAEARDLLGTSRRYAQALLEHMDSEGLTLRVGEARRLRRRRR